MKKMNNAYGWEKDQKYIWMMYFTKRIREAKILDEDQCIAIERQILLQKTEKAGADRHELKP